VHTTHNTEPTQQENPLAEAEGHFETLKKQMGRGWYKVDVQLLFSLEEAISRCLLVENLTDAQMNRLAILYRATQSAWVGIFGKSKAYRDIEKLLGPFLADAEFEKMQKRANSRVRGFCAVTCILTRNLLRAFSGR